MKNEPKSSAQVPSARAPVAGAKRAAFSAAMLAIPLVVIAVAEVSLRLFGVGDAFPLFEEIPNYEHYSYPSEDVAGRYFRPGATLPSIPFDSFTSEKDSSTLRIVVQGGSSAAGYPFYFGGSFSDMLEQRLLQSFPGRNVEVVNTAMAAVNSYTLLDLSKEIVEVEPDAILIYAGHNEYYGALGVGSTESVGQSRWVIRTYLWAWRFRVTQVLRKAIGAIASLKSDGEIGPPGSTLMQRVVRDQSIPLGGPVYRSGIDQFERNMAPLLERYRRTGIPVYIATIASNQRSHRPFISRLSTGTDSVAWAKLRSEATSAAAAGDTARALDGYRQLLAVDDGYAEAWFDYATLLYSSGRVDDARPAFIAASDRDLLRFRAPSAINAAIARLADAHGAYVVDAEGALAARSPGGIVGGEFMTEHLHPSISGYFIIADAFYDALVEKSDERWDRVVSESVARSEMLVTPIDSIVGYMRIDQLTSSWPFEPMGTIRELDMSQYPDDIEHRVSWDLYRGRVDRREALEALRRQYVSDGDLHGALRVTLSVIQRYPFLATPYLAAASVLMEQGRLDEALLYTEVANDREESALALRMAGSILLRRDMNDEAIALLERSVELEPDVQALYNLGGGYARTGQYAQARRTVLRVLELDPGHAEARRLGESLPGGLD